MEDEDYRIMVLNDTTMKCFRDGRIFTLFKRTNQYGKKGEWVERITKPNNEGYIPIRLGKKAYLSHRLIMIAFVGESDQDVDHINRIKTDNRFENLRYCTGTENQLNRDWVDNAKGYYLYQSKWTSYININGKKKHLGCFDKEEDAREAYVVARDKRKNDL